MRSSFIALAATMAIAAVAPSSALAAKGWKLPTHAADVQGFHVASSATHCGASKFGAWRFRGKISAEGLVAKLRWKVAIAKNGKLHRLGSVSVTGTAPKAAKKFLRDTYRGLRMRYARGTPAQLKTVTPSGGLYSTRDFNPKRNSC